MKKTLLAGLATGIMMLGMTSVNALALTVTSTNDGTTLVNAILGSGITASNISYSGANTAASGTFTNGGNIGFASGILLTTGDAESAEGPNSSSSTSGPGATTSLSFDFTSNAGDLYFNYIFASEEYNEYVGSGFNDNFSFLLDGVNIALIPGTTTPVSINNVNLVSNSAYYVNNSPGSIDTEYDGLTTVLTAQALGLSTGTHTIVMTINDVGDSAWDSGVFIQGGTFSDTPSEVPEPGTMLLMGAGLFGLVGYNRKRFGKKN